MGNRLSSLLISACLALSPALGWAMPVEGNDSSSMFPFRHVAGGYTYQTETGEFLSFTLPQRGDGRSYHLRFEGQNGPSVQISSGQTYVFGPGVNWFSVFCFDPESFFDADDPNAFPLSYQLGGDPSAEVIAEAVLIDFSPVLPTPLPASLWLLLAASGGLIALTRRARA